MEFKAKHEWWSLLRHSGLLISPVMLEEVFPAGLSHPDDFNRQLLRDRYNRFAATTVNDQPGGGSLEPVLLFADHIFGNFLGFAGRMLKGRNLDSSFAVQTLSGEIIKPDRIIASEPGSTTPFFALFAETHKRLGIGKSRKKYGLILRYLRTRNIKLAIQTNGDQIRLIHAGLDYESWVEWDVADWLESAEHLQKLSGFFTLLGPTGITPGADSKIPLLKAIEGSRNKQSELSSILGEQIRQAIELLVDDFSSSYRKKPAIFDSVKKNPDGSELSEEEALNAVLQASVRIIMRIVVILFAEARELLPRSLATYHSNYGVEGMFENLRAAKSGEPEEFFEETQSEWLKLLGLFRLIYFGSSHPELQIPRYGGQLFAPGDLNSSDPVSRALAVYESDEVEVPNGTMLNVLDRLKFGKLKIKQGNKTAFVKGPVDFSELRTEYIGIIYEGILDYMLRSSQETMVLLNIGLQPILPLSVLETLDKKELKNLFEQFSKVQKDDGEEDQPGEEIQEEEEPETEENDEDEPDESDEDETASGDERIKAWAQNAVVEMGLVKKTGKLKDPFLFSKTVDQRARGLIKRVYRPGDFYLSLWGGTRKGTGTFYTKPQLAVPTVRRTLEPLAYLRDENNRLVPKHPEEILSVKVCDPGCGSASFLVAATHYLTGALYDSLVVHARLLDPNDHVGKTLPFGLKVDSSVEAEYLPCRPDDDRFEEMVKARLRRSVVEFCIYGVDLNPMAVELARLSLWIETMDRSLPFEFLDHKIKTGNSLIGAWLDTYLEYPLAAWKREGGDKSHPSSVNHPAGERTNIIKQLFREKIKKETGELILRRQGEGRLEFIPDPVESIETHSALFKAYQDLHGQSGSMFGAEQREKIYIEKILKSEEYRKLKEAMDLWCSVWFWDAENTDGAPSPLSFYNPPEDTRKTAARIAAGYRFFHWEIEFPDVFNKHRKGFDAIIGNPPWETSKPNSKEYFSRLDPVYRSYGKQEAISYQKKYFEAYPRFEAEWLDYLASYKAQSNYFSNAFTPFGDPLVSDDDRISLASPKQSAMLHGLWREQRKKNTGFAETAHPYRYQGSADLNLYKLFLEQSHYLLKKFGRLGMIVPSGIYSDKGTLDLRELFLERSEWEWLFVFENRAKIFDIDSRLKFNPLIVQKGGETKKVRTAFMRTDLSDWENETAVMDYEKELISKLSPVNLAFMELKTRKDADIVEKIFSNSALFESENITNWNLEYGTEFHMTNDSKLFHNRNKLLEKGYVQDEYGRLTGPEGDKMLPLYQGVMIWQFDYSAAGYISGAGNRAKWREIGMVDKPIEAQFYVRVSDFGHMNGYFAGMKLAFRDVTGATNERTCVSTLLNNHPCGNVLGVLSSSSGPIVPMIILAAVLNSFVYDFVIRMKMVGSHMNLFVLSESPVIPLQNIRQNILNKLTFMTLCISLPGSLNSIAWLKLASEINIKSVNIKAHWAITHHERLRIRCILDAAVAELYGLSYEDLEWILKDDRTDPKGFWRVDKEKPKELRHTTLTLEAFKRLKEVGLENFLEEDWQFRPEIAAQLGPRFLDWQLEGTPEESWAECEYHARRILGDDGYKKFTKELENPQSPHSKQESLRPEETDEWKLF